MAYREYPGKGGKDPEGWAGGQTSPGLKSTSEGHYAKKPGNPKMGNPFGRKDTSDNGPGTRTYPKSGQKGSRPGTDASNMESGVSVDMNLRTMPKAQ